MGSTLMGGAKYGGNIQLQTPQQQQLMSGLLESLIGGAPGAAAQALQGPGEPSDYQDLFQQAYIDPAMMAYQQDILPAIQESMGAMNASSSSALNQALARSARDISTQLGSQMGQFYQGMRGQDLQAQLSALGMVPGMATQQTFVPHMRQQTGLLPGLINLGAGYLRGGVL